MKQRYRFEVEHKNITLEHNGQCKIFQCAAISAKSLLVQKKSLQGQFPKDAAAAANDVMMTITQ